MKITTVSNLNHMFFSFSFQDRVSLYSPDYPETHSVDQTSPKLRDPPASLFPECWD